MKIFLSVPMSGLSNDDILKELETVTEVAISYFPFEASIDELEFVSGFDNEAPPKDVMHDKVYYLGESIKSLATCDAILAPMYLDNDGCYVEREVAVRYGLETYWYDPKIFDRE